jgi:DUF4097 and DUF4098 domain-containing protein YvlB
MTMPTFDTPEPISVAIDVGAGIARTIASDRADTVVDVRPTDASSEPDVRDAEQTRVEYSDGRLLVKAPKRRALTGRRGSIDVTIELPAGSRVRGDAAAAAFRGEGRLGESRFTTAAGDIQLDQTGALHLTTARGDVTVNRTVGGARVTVAAGDVRIGEIDGAAAIKSAHGDTWVGEATGDLRASAANGDISIDRAHATVVAKTAHGSVRIGEVARGSVVLQSGAGELEVGVREGTAAWLDLSSQSGGVQNSLDAVDGPGDSDETVEVRARTSHGDIVIRRS